MGDALRHDKFGGRDVADRTERGVRCEGFADRQPSELRIERDDLQVVPPVDRSFSHHFKRRFFRAPAN